VQEIPAVGELVRRASTEQSPGSDSATFKNFLVSEIPSLISQIVPFDPST
jgi:hypothetical protein